MGGWTDKPNRWAPAKVRQTESSSFPRIRGAPGGFRRILVGEVPAAAVRQLLQGLEAVEGEEGATLATEVA